jgi:prevent-host-death family protein
MLWIMKSGPIAQTRKRLSSLVDETAATGEAVVITKFGTPKAMLVPVSERVQLQHDDAARAAKIESLAGMWKDRPDAQDTVAFAERLRREAGRG